MLDYMALSERPTTIREIAKGTSIGLKTVSNDIGVLVSLGMVVTIPTGVGPIKLYVVLPSGGDSGQEEDAPKANVG